VIEWRITARWATGKWEVELASVVEASSDGTIEGASPAAMITVRVLVEVRPFWSVAT
jgi:hypothetical protein